MVEGRPEFEYRVNGTPVRELITPTADSAGLARTFRVGETDRPVRFVRSAQEGVTVEASTGTWAGDTLRVPPADAREFVVTVKPTAGR